MRPHWFQLNSSCKTKSQLASGVGVWVERDKSLVMFFFSLFTTNHLYHVLVYVYIFQLSILLYLVKKSRSINVPLHKCIFVCKGKIKKIYLKAICKKKKILEGLYYKNVKTFFKNKEVFEILWGPWLSPKIFFFLKHNSSPALLIKIKKISKFS